MAQITCNLSPAALRQLIRDARECGSEPGVVLSDLIADSLKELGDLNDVEVKSVLTGDRRRWT